MHGVAAKSIPHPNVAQREEVIELAKFHDPQARAVSFYLSSASFADKSHRAELISIKQLARTILKSHLNAYPRSQQLLADLDAVLEAAEEMGESSPGFKAIFACGSKRAWQEFDLPVKTDIRFLKADKEFYFAPLVRAVDLCRPYAIVLVERGKARGFVARGVSIEEIPRFFSRQDLRLHPDDSRVGWSHHVEGDEQQHAQQYMRKLSGEINRFLEAQGCADLVVGCRQDLWGEIGLHLVSSTPNTVRGQFHLPGFETSPREVLEIARPVFDLYEKKRFANLLGTAYSPRGVVGGSAVREQLDQGRVKTLLLGAPSDATLLKCARCGCSVAQDAKACPSCQSTELRGVNAQELLVREALLTNTEIVSISFFEASASDNVAAILRY
jgi:peptide subunit release factor 1 (eRF1)